MIIEKLVQKHGRFISLVAMMISTASVNRSCMFFAYQPKLPTEIKKLRKF